MKAAVRSAALLGLGMLTAIARAAGPGAVDDARLLRADLEPENWLTHGGTWREQRYSRLDAINTANVARLAPAWYVEFDTSRGQESTPLVVDGVLYVTTAWSKVYALDAASGRQLWYFDPKVPGPAGVPTCCDVNNRGVAVYQGKVFVGTLDGRLIALDAGSGKPVWSVPTVEPGRIYTITGAPRAARGKVYIGNAGADFGGRGYVSAYDAATGRLAWRFYTVPGDPRAKPDGAASDEVLAHKARPTWFGEWYRYGGGGHVWNALVYDPDLNQIYMGTGNGYPWNRSFRSAGKGDNLFISSIVAVDADTGSYKWHYQETPGDQWDYDSIADITLTELDIDGARRKVLLHAPKNGFFYVIDRASGRLISAQPYVPGVNWASHIDSATGRPEVATVARYRDTPWVGIPGGGGGHNWYPVAFSPRTGFAYIPATENSTRYNPTPSFEYVEGQPNIGVDLFGAQHGAATAGKPTSTTARAYLLAWNPVTQTAAWRVPGRGGGVLATAGDLVFQGRNRDGLLGELTAFRAEDGARLWSHRAPDAILAGPITYRVGREQFVAVTSGASVMSFGAKGRMRHSGHLIAFKLGGTADLPPDPPLAARANPPAQHASTRDFAVGEERYGKYCSRCHGFETESPNVIPDLRRSAVLTQPETWQDIVIGGILADHGMIGWRRFLTAPEAETIRAYVGEKARALASSEQAP
jgi:quinohemoprotein ethanol dehydrogenase